MALNLSQQHSKLIQHELDQQKQQNRELLRSVQALREEKASLTLMEVKWLEEKSLQEALLNQRIRDHDRIMTEKTRLESDNAKLRSVYDDVSTALVLAEKEIADMRKASTTDKASFERENQSLKSELRHLNDRNALLLSDLQNLDQEKALLNMTSTKLRNDLEAKSRELAVAELSIEKLKMQVTDTDKRSLEYVRLTFCLVR
jgi:chromosome segregation ATPase